MKRTRFFTCLVYENLCSYDDLIQRLESWEFIKGFVISPLHIDAKYNHWHVVIRTCDQVSLDNVREHSRNEIPNTVHNNYFEKVLKFDSIIDYLTHSNEKNKLHYDVKDCYVVNFPQAKKIIDGFARKGYLSDLMCYIESGDFTETWQFFNYIYNEDVTDDFLKWCVAHSNFINQLLTSRRFSTAGGRSKDEKDEN